MDEIRRIIQDYKEEMEVAGSEYRRRCLKEDAFDAILKVIESIDKTESEIKALIDEERMLTEHDNSTVYKRRGE